LLPSARLLLLLLLLLVVAVHAWRVVLLLNL
jgi:hypothetical protein